jgi:hypothetical protein
MVKFPEFLDSPPYGELLIMTENGRWELIRRLKGYCIFLYNLNTMGYTVEFQNSLFLGEFQKISRKLFYIIKNKYYFLFINFGKGARGGVVVKALRYKPTGRGFDSRWCHWNFSVT